ncbi:hypothetical protein FRC14_001095 [Serendipita sp. 396]|nr:hypothetical protein FRC14_001095 [Serendipita sp. 396]
MSSHPPRRHSEEFPENYGDFQLVSSDGVVFSIPRIFLSHVSPVFRDMLNLGMESPNELAELQLTESSVTLDQLLRFFDPLKDPAPIDTKTVEPLLESARKYQIEHVFKYWEEQMVFRDEAKQIAKVYSPLACLALACHFGRREMTRLALRELLRAPSKDFQTPTRTIIDSGMLSHLFQLRQARLTQMMERIVEVQEGIKKGTRCRNGHLDVVHSFLGLIIQLVDEPSWNTLQRNINSWSECDGWGRSDHSGILTSSKCILSPIELFEKWKPDILAEESKLPELPSSLL